MKNAVAKMCNSSLDWAQGAQKSVDKITGAIQVGMQHVAQLNEQEQQVSWFFIALRCLMIMEIEN